VIASATVNSVPEFLIQWAVVTVGALVGNVIGFELGRRVGPALRETKLISKRAAHMSYRTFLPPVEIGAACSTALPLLAGVGVAAGLKNAGNMVVIIAVGVLLALVAVFVIRKRRKNTRAKTTTVDMLPHDADQDPDADLEPGALSNATTASREGRQSR
jgi:membrane-associated protein